MCRARVPVSVGARFSVSAVALIFNFYYYYYFNFFLKSSAVGSGWGGKKIRKTRKNVNKALWRAEFGDSGFRGEGGSLGWGEGGEKEKKNIKKRILSCCLSGGTSAGLFPAAPSLRLRPGQTFISGAGAALGSSDRRFADLQFWKLFLRFFLLFCFFFFPFPLPPRS